MEYVLGPARTERNGDVFVRLADNAKKCVVFFGTPDSRTGKMDFCGTGFLVGMRGEGKGLAFHYLVTAKHVARALDAGFILRANLIQGGAEEITIDHLKWTYHPSNAVDVAVARLQLDTGKYDVVYFNSDQFLTKDLFQKARMGAGDFINIVGVFKLLVGEKRNLALVHTGHLALLPEEGETIPVKDRLSKKTINVEGYLVEAQTFEGLSGAPTFIRKGEHWGIYLLGLYQGAWDGLPGEILARDRGLDKKEIRVPVGMGIVVPAWRILEVLDMPELKQKRDRAIAAARSANAATMDSAVASDASDNPEHREDFTALLGAAAKKKPQDGQT